MLYIRELDYITNEFLVVNSRTREKFAVNEEELIDILKRGISVIGVALLSDSTLVRYDFNDEVSKLVTLKKGDSIAMKIPFCDCWLTVRFKGVKNCRFVFQLGLGIYKLSVTDIVKGKYMFSFSEVNQVVETTLAVADDFPSDLDD